MKTFTLLFISVLVLSQLAACATLGPLGEATKSGDINKINFLISKGSDVNERDPKTGWTPLLNAVSYRQKETVKLLIEKGADVNTGDVRGCTPLLFAVEYDYKDIVSLLVENGADMNLRNKEGYTPLSMSIHCLNPGIAKYLIEKGADVNLADGNGDPPLTHAITYDDGCLVDLLLSRGAETEVYNGSGRTPLVEAASFGRTEMVRLLIRKGAYVNAYDRQGYTALHSAVRAGHWDTAKLLVDEGADVHYYDYSGKKASDYALSPERSALSKQFRKIVNADADKEQRESLRKLLKEREAKQIPGRTHVAKLAGCTPISTKEILGGQRERPWKVAVLPVRYPPQTEAIKFVEMSGIKKGALGGLEFGSYVGAQIGVATLAPGGAMLLLPVGALAGLVGGTIYGVVSMDYEKEELAEKKALETENETRRILIELKIQENMAKHIKETGEKETHRNFVIFNELGPLSPGDRPNYTSIADQGFNDILEIAVTKIGTGSIGEGETARYYFFMTAQASLIRGTRIFTPQFKYILGPPLTLSEWVRLDGEKLRNEIDKAYIAIAEDMIDYVFAYAFFEAEYSQLPSGNLSQTIDAIEKVFKIPVSKVYSTRYVLGGLYGVSPYYPPPLDDVKIYDLRPTFSWEAFPAQEDIRADRGKGILKHVGDVTYDLRVWQANYDSGSGLIYERRGLKDNRHKIECSLEPSGKYLWSIRARFRIGNEEKMTRWSSMYWRDLATYERQRNEGAFFRNHLRSIDASRFYGDAIPVMRSHYFFTTRQ